MAIFAGAITPSKTRPKPGLLPDCAAQRATTTTIPWIVAVPLTLDVGEEGATGDVELLLTDVSHRVVSARLRLNKAFMLEAGESFLVAVAQHQDGTDASKRIFTLTKITRNDWTGGVAQKSTDYHLVGDKLVAFSSAVK